MGANRKTIQALGTINITLGELFLGQSSPVV